MDDVNAAARLPLVHVQARATYNISELAALLAPHLEPAPASALPAEEMPAPTSATSSTVTCPKKRRSHGAQDGDAWSQPRRAILGLPQLPQVPRDPALQARASGRIELTV